jgi:hypothetical protein
MVKYSSPYGSRAGVGVSVRTGGTVGVSIAACEAAGGDSTRETGVGDGAVSSLILNRLCGTTNPNPNRIVEISRLSKGRFMGIS